MDITYSEVEIKELPELHVASYSVLSANPESDAELFIRKWLQEHGLKYENLRCFGFSIQLTLQEKLSGLFAYEYCAVVPENIMEADGVKIKTLRAGKYVAIKITNPMSNLQESITLGWQLLDEWYMKSEFSTLEAPEGKPFLAEFICPGNIKSIYLYRPLKG
jgi:DNA gyrase inhibitor GyrI